MTHATVRAADPREHPPRRRRRWGWWWRWPPSRSSRCQTASSAGTCPSRRAVQDEQGDLATLAEEGAVGPRMFVPSAAAGRARVHHPAAARLRHERGEQGRPALRRPATAGRLRPGAPGRPGRADPRRGHQLARRALGAARAARPAHHPGRPDGGDHRAPAVHGRDRRTASWCSSTGGSWRTGCRTTSSRAALAATPTSTTPGWPPFA